MANTKIPSELVAINAIQGTLIADNAITAVHVAQNQIHSVQLAINSVTALQIADGTITSAKIADGTIVTADIADGQITTGKIADSSVTTGKIASGTILGGDIANNAILTQHIDDNQITADQIADNAVGLDQMAGITRGSVIYGNAAGNPAYLAAGTSGHVLTSDGTDISWTADTDLFLATAGGTITGDLTISEATPTLKFTDTDNNYDATIAGLSGSLVLTADSGAEIGTETIQFHRGGSESMRITATGVGIGTTGPSEKLVVNVNSTGIKTGLILNNQHGYGSGVGVAAASLQFGRDNSPDNGQTIISGQIYSGNENETTSNPCFMAFSTKSGTSPYTLTEHMRISSTGNVGIGTSNPQFDLDVTGLIRATSDVYLQGDVYVNAKIRHNGDVDNYITFSAADTQGFITGNSTRLQITNSLVRFNQENNNQDFSVYSANSDNMLYVDASTDRVGIGTSSPDASLEVVGSSNSTYLIAGGDDSSNGRGLTFTSSASTNFNGAVHTIRAPSSQGVIAFKTYNTEAMRIDSSGNVGIGTISPDHQLDIENSSNAVMRLHAGTNSSASLRLQNDAQHWDVNCQTTDTFAIYNQTSNTQPFSILPNGNVGIGTDSPDGLLHISSGNSGNAIVIIQADEDNNNESDNPQLWFKQDGDITEGAIRLSDNRLQIINNVNSVGGISFITGNQLPTGTTDPATGATEKVRIETGGDVKIGSFDTGNAYKLEVYDGDYTQLMLRAPTYPILKFKADNQNSGNNGSIGIGASNSLVLQPNNATNGINISNSGHVTMSNQPKFHAFGGSSTAQGSDVIYASTYVNDGGHYNTSNGRFTAPVAGVYLFFWSAIGNTTNDVYRWYLRVNGSAAISGTGNDVHLRQDNTATGSEYASNGSRVQMLDLAVNDYVTINFQSDSNSSHYVGSDYINFGGYLIG